MALTKILLLVEVDTEPRPEMSTAPTIREKYVLVPKKLLDHPILEAFQLNGFKVVVDGILKCSKNKTFDLINAQVGENPVAGGKPLIYVDQLHQEFVQEQCKSECSVGISNVTTLEVLSEEHSQGIKSLLASECRISYRDNKGSTFLHFLVETGFPDLLKLFLNHTCNVNAERYDNATALHIAVERKNIQMTSLLVANGANANAKMKNGSTPLSLAFAGGPEEMVELLIKNGASVDLKMGNGETPLISAVDKDYLKVVQLLIARGANVNFKTEDGSTALILALKEGYFLMVKMVELLIANGADVNSGMNDGTTPLHFAVWGGHTQIVEHLLNHGANPDAKSDEWDHKGCTPLHIAVLYDRCEIVALLLDKGANVNAECSDGKTALYFAVDRINSVDHKIIEVLGRYGPDVNNAWNKDAFKRAISNFSPEYRQMTSSLLQCGFDVTVEDAADSALLCGAISQNLHLVVEKLLNFGASINDSTDLAARYADGDMIQLLVDHGSLPLAIKYSKLDAAKALLTKNANVKNLSGLLHSAIEHCPELAESLLENGVDVNAENSCGERPSFVAMRCKKLDSLELLVKFGARCGVRHAYIYSDSCKYLNIFEAYLNYDFRKVEPARHDDRIHKVLNFSLPEGAEVFAHFLVKLKVAYESISLEKLISSSRLNLSQFEEICRAEIAEMKQKNIGRTSVTFFDFLTASTRQVARCLRNENVFEALKELDVSALYPNYGPIIECQLRKGTWRRESIVKGVKLFGVLLIVSGLPRLPDELKERIVDFLSNQDMLVLRKCLPLLRK